MTKRKRDLARRKLVRIARQNDLVFVIWWGHFGNTFVALERGGKCELRPEIYGAMMEQFYDVIKTCGRSVFTIDLPHDCEDTCSWKSVLRKVRRLLGSGRVRLGPCDGKCRNCTDMICPKRTEWFKISSEEIYVDGKLVERNTPPKTA